LGGGIPLLFQLPADPRSKQIKVAYDFAVGWRELCVEEQLL
jgi:hypothetical protein